MKKLLAAMLMLIGGGSLHAARTAASIEILVQKLQADARNCRQELTQARQEIKRLKAEQGNIENRPPIKRMRLMPTK